jgi:hypothetical protein
MLRFTQHKGWWQRKQYHTNAIPNADWDIGEDERIVVEHIKAHGTIGASTIGFVSDVSHASNQISGYAAPPRDWQPIDRTPATKEERRRAQWEREQAEKQREKTRQSDIEWARPVQETSPTALAKATSDAAQREIERVQQIAHQEHLLKVEQEKANSELAQARSEIDRVREANAETELKRIYDIIAKNQGITMPQLCQKLNCSHMHVVTRVDEIVRRGWIVFR